MLILRTARNCRCDYEWNQHSVVARDLGLSDVEIGQIASEKDYRSISEPEQDLLAAADELHFSARISDQTWDKLAHRYDYKQLIEICLLVGQYHVAAFALNSLGVPPEPWHQRPNW